MIDKMMQLLKRYREFVMYAVCGAGTVAVDMSVYVLLVDVLSIRSANAIGWTCAVVFAFFSNKYWVFRRRREGRRAFWVELTEFFLVRLVSLVLEVQGVEFLVLHGLGQSLLGVTGGVAKVVITLVVIVINYVLSKFLVFREKKDHGGTDEG